MIANLPDRIRSACSSLFTGDLYFVPIRHHSPACSMALSALIEEVRPSLVLIEGPDHFDALLPLLQDPRTKPPVAVLCQNTGKGEDGSSAFFPLCDYSPEWVALQCAEKVGASVRFIDLPWSERLGDRDGEAANLLAERHLAHSAYLSTLARLAGCRDHDELWDQLFELRERAAMTDWRALFVDVFAYCAMARLDYEPAALEADGSAPRERHMLKHLRAARSEMQGSIVVVTGGFHTLALVEMWALEAKSVRA